METAEDIKQLITTIKELEESGKADEESYDFWADAGARILIFMDSVVRVPEKVNALTPREYSKKNICILESNFNILARMSNYANEPFDNKIWSQENVNTISFYELAQSRCCGWISQLLGDRFNYVQKLLIKNIFSNSEVCSLFASDIYMFVMRLMHSNHKMSMCQLIMNLCRIAPPEAFVKGAALINRFKHPIVNFENPKYQYLLDFS